MKSYFRLSALITALVCLLPMSVASAGGYDTPMLYSARHMGMGGTAVASVNDPSALFHNPAGLLGTERLTLMANFSPLLGTITGNPAGNNQNVTSDMTFAPFFLAGVSARLSENVAIGFAAYPVASAGAAYSYEHMLPAEPGETPMTGMRTDSTKLFFFELSPGISFQLPNIPIRIGVGYRMTYVSLDRERDASLTPTFNPLANSGTDFSMSGWSFSGFRFGMHYQMFERFSLGLSYRHRTQTELNGSGSLNLFGNQQEADLTSKITLPSRLSFGFRMNLDSFSFAADAEYGFQSQNPDGAIEGFMGAPITQVSRWQGAWTVRLGAEYRLMNGRLPIRAGFIWDQQTSNPTYPSAFGTPPAPTYTGTLGAGFDMGSWQANLSGAFRYGSTTITPEDITGRDSCTSCSFAGDASIRLGGIYLDFSYHFGRGAPQETRAGINYGDADPFFGSDDTEEDHIVEESVVQADSPAVSPANQQVLEAEIDEDVEARRERLQQQAAEAQAATAAAHTQTNANAAAAAEEEAEE